jgi:exosortase C (VPDSG-CTERM-specific)
MKNKKLFPTVAAEKLPGIEVGQSSSLPSGRRRPGLMAAAIVTLMLLFALPLISLFIHAAGNKLHSYILLVPFVAGYLFWIRKTKLPRHYTTASAAAACFVVLAFAALVSAVIAGNQGVLSTNDWLSLIALSFVSCLAAAGFLILGRPWMTSAAFPFAFLIFMVPMPDGMVNAMETASQHASAAAAELFFRFGRTPYLHEGMIFQLPNITLEVAQECSGIRSSWILLITSILAANLFLQTTWKRLLLVFLVIPLGILRNGFRVWVIGMLCVHYGPQIIHSPIHRRGGPLFFALSLVPLFLITAWLRRTDLSGRRSAPTQPADAEAVRVEASRKR